MTRAFIPFCPFSISFCQFFSALSFREADKKIAFNFRFGFIINKSFQYIIFMKRGNRWYWKPVRRQRLVSGSRAADPKEFKSYETNWGRKAQRQGSWSQSHRLYLGHQDLWNLWEARIWAMDLPNMVERIRDFKAEIWDLEGILVRERGCVRIGD